MEYIKVRNWQKWQSYRADRGQPPWIKVHRCVMRDPGWASLSDAQRGQLVGIWLLAADRDGRIPGSPEMIQRLCLMDSPPDLQLFAYLGFIDDATLASSWRQGGDMNDASETETETEEKQRQKRSSPPAGGDRASPGDKSKESEEAWISWREAIKSRSDDEERTVDAYLDALERSIEQFYRDKGGQGFTPARKKRLAKRLQSAKADPVLLAIEIYVDRYTGLKDERYFAGIVASKGRLSQNEFLADMERHRKNMGTVGLAMEV